MSSLVTFGETSVRLRPAGDERLETTPEARMEVSGAESNVAVAASQLGADATWVSKLPDSPLGRRVDRAVCQHGIDTEISWAQDGRQSLQFAELGTTPRESRQLEDRDHAAIASVEPSELPITDIQTADGVFVAGSTLALSEEAAETAGAVLRAVGDGLVAMDLDFRPELLDLASTRDRYEDIFGAVDVLFANEDQARTVFEQTGTLREMAHKIASKAGFEIVVITRSEWGAVVWDDSVIHEQDTVETDVIDPAGQHDAFVGAFIERLLAGAATDEALNDAVAAAALTRTLPGAMTTITEPEVADLADSLTETR